MLKIVIVGELLDKDHTLVWEIKKKTLLDTEL